MGIFWDLIQQNQLEKQKSKADSLEERISILEDDLKSTKGLLLKTLKILEQQSGTDINNDGRIG